MILEMLGDDLELCSFLHRIAFVSFLYKTLQGYTCTLFHSTTQHKEILKLQHEGILELQQRGILELLRSFAWGAL